MHMLKSLGAEPADDLRRVLGSCERRTVLVQDLNENVT